MADSPTPSNWLPGVDLICRYRVYAREVNQQSAPRAVQVRSLPHCPNIEQVRELVRRAAAAAGAAVLLEELVGDYPSPTVLVDGLDVTGAPLAEGAYCRLDLPTEGQIQAALQGG